MKLLLIRHGDPDYSIDSLTEKGWREAELLSRRIAALNIKAFYVSPLGRAQDTASVTLRRMNRTARTLPWLREFQASAVEEASGTPYLPWDRLPAEWTAVPEYYDKKRWGTVPSMRLGRADEEAAWIAAGLDALLREHGYERDGLLYRAVSPSNDTLALFCHFGVTCVMLGHLLGMSPVLLWHAFCAAPSSVTTVVTEERREGTAAFRMSAFGDISHLHAAGVEPSFAGRFCEAYGNEGERCD